MIALGVDIGGTKIAVGLVDQDGRILRQVSVPTPAREGAEAILDAVRAAAMSLITEVAEPVAGCGVGAAGVIDPSSGVVTSATSSLAGWAGTDVPRRLQSLLGLPVRVINDVHAHALAESRIGAGAGADRLLLLALGTGIGGAIVDHGRPVRGRTGAAGHFGHVPVEQAAGLPCPCGSSGHLEAVASGPAILERYRTRLSVNDTDPQAVTDTREVFRRAADGDRVAKDCTQEAAAAIGAALGGLINSYDPDLVVLNGGLSRADPAWFADIVERTGAATIEVTADCPVVLSELADASAIAGAALWYSTERMDAHDVDTATVARRPGDVVSGLSR